MLQFGVDGLVRGRPRRNETFCLCLLRIPGIVLQALEVDVGGGINQYLSRRFLAITPLHVNWKHDDYRG